MWAKYLRGLSNFLVEKGDVLHPLSPSRDFLNLSWREGRQTTLLETPPTHTMSLLDGEDRKQISKEPVISFHQLLLYIYNSCIYSTGKIMNLFDSRNIVDQQIVYSFKCTTRFVNFNSVEPRLVHVLVCLCIDPLICWILLEFLSLQSRVCKCHSRSLEK